MEKSAREQATREAEQERLGRKSEKLQKQGLMEEFNDAVWKNEELGRRVGEEQRQNAEKQLSIDQLSIKIQQLEFKLDQIKSQST